MATVGEGTVCGEQAEVSHFGAALFRESGAAIPNLLLTPSVLIRHKCGEFEGVLGSPAWGGLARHPAGIRVTKLCAFPGAVPRHGYIWEGPEICKQGEKVKEGGKSIKEGSYAPKTSSTAQAAIMVKLDACSKQSMLGRM